MRLRRALAVAIGLAAGLSIAAFLYYDRWLDRPLTLTEARIVEILPGDSSSTVADRLAQAGLIDHPEIFVLHARLTHSAARIRAGEYRIDPGHTPRRMLADFVAGRVVSYDVRILEGWTLRDVLTTLRATPKLVDDLEGATAEDLLEALGLGQGSGEGLFFPDTYHYTKGTTISSILRAAHARMASVLAAAWEGRAPDLPFASPYDALVLASIVEKETGLEADRDKVSRVFVSRLQRGMRLQSDPTVIYGLGTAFDGNLTRADLDADGPYNTYRRGGLPPTPIALPGRASIDATLHPAEGDYLYFVARGDGSSEFSPTLEAHVAAVRRFQLKGASP